MSAQTLFRSLFSYKALADQEIVEALSLVPNGLTFPNMQAALRVLDHANIVDQIFAAHLQGLEHPFLASWPEKTPELPELARRVTETDRWYLDYAADLVPDELEEVVSFKFTDGKAGRMSREEMLAHVITHSGFHRGEAGRLLPEIESVSMRDVFAGFLHRSEPQRRA